MQRNVAVNPKFPMAIKVISKNSSAPYFFICTQTQAFSLSGIKAFIPCIFFTEIVLAVFVGRLKESCIFNVLKATL
jgi:hypothetical protein